jgi:hypothetical protein
MKLFFKKLAKGAQPESLPAFSSEVSQIAVDQSEMSKAGLTPDVLKEKLENKFKCHLQGAAYYRNQVQFNIERNVAVEVEL